MRQALHEGTAVGTWEEVSPETHGLELLMTGLRRSEGIHLGELSRQTGLDMDHVFASPMNQLLEAGLLMQKGERIRLKEEAIPISDAIFLEFF